MRRSLLVVLVAIAAVSAGVAGVLVSSSLEGDPAADRFVGSDTHDTGSPADAEVGANLTVHFLDVGQGDATVVEFPDGETMLIDSGDWRDDGDAVVSYLEELGVDRIDHLISTHGHADHIGGHGTVIDHFEREGAGIGAVYDSGLAHTTATYDRYLDAIERHDVDLFEVQAGDGFAIGRANVTVLNPPAERDSADLDDNSVAVVLEYDSVRFLFTGDAGTAAETRMVEDGAGSVNATVYQAGHHGSNTSSSPGFLDAVDPRFAVISSARDSQYGHPHDEVLERFAERGTAAYWTGVHGDVVFRTDGTDLSVEAEYDASADPAALLRKKPDEERESVVGPDDYGVPVPGSGYR